MTDAAPHSETRKVLWERARTERLNAQDFDATYVRLIEDARKAEAAAAECRRRADHLEIAADWLGEVDRLTHPAAPAETRKG